MAKQSSHAWEPISDLPLSWKETLQDKQTLNMVKAWHEQADSLREQELYTTFLARLKRQWAIETGVIEGLYSISEGATIELIEKGLDAVDISHEETDENPELVLARIQDQHDAIAGLYQFVVGDRPLGTSYIRELHAALTRHQTTYVARDTLGNTVTRTLPRGEYKRLPNNVEHPDGSRFEYCPPEHVDAEMERLVNLHHEHLAAHVTPEVESAWIHHRFTLIHPFTDGNGRVARCLATLVLLREHWLPLVITRRDRDAYIAALRSADAANLKPLVDLFSDLQRKGIREALSLSSQIYSESQEIGSILAAAGEKFRERRQAEEDARRRALRTADSLQLLARQRLSEIAQEVQDFIHDIDPHFRSFMYEAPRGDGRSRWHYHQTIQYAKRQNFFANLPRYQAWAALAIVTGERTEILFSFHGIGHSESGILGCSAMAYTKEASDDGDNLVREVIPLSDSPFEFSYLDDPTDVQQRFSHWLESCVRKGLDYWRTVV